ncbi:MAG: hypothetical protein IMZ53_12490 [Thermoplasmata archaeon]|nr:hypothetical protein [Thermoplasmata archaeon]MBE3141384.1 hypothetical protein [Thermoplasmata archaeon]
MTEKAQKQRQGEKIIKTRQKSHAVASKSITSGIISPAVKDVLNGLSIGGLYITEFGWFERTGEKELTMIMITENPNFKAESLVEQLKKIVESMGWIFKRSDKMKYSGAVYYMGKKKELTVEEAEAGIKHCEEMTNMRAKLKKAENTKISSEDIIEFKPGDMKFKGDFQELIDFQEERYSLMEFFLGDTTASEGRCHYKLKKIVLIFSNEKGTVRRMTFKEEDAPVEEI